MSRLQLGPYSSFPSLDFSFGHASFKVLNQILKRKMKVRVTLFIKSIFLVGTCSLTQIHARPRPPRARSKTAEKAVQSFETLTSYFRLNIHS